MLFIHTWQKVLSGEKSQTRRIMKPGDYVFSSSDHEPATIRDVWSKNRRMKYAIGQTLAVQPGRTAKGIARIRITGICQEDVRNISFEDACAEGFKDKDPAANIADTIYGGFLKTWCGMHDKPAVWEFDPARVDYWINTGKRRELVGFDTVKEIIMSRPAERYQAWAMTFTLEAE